MNNERGLPNQLAAKMRALRIVIVAMAGGLLVFSIVVVVAVQRESAPVDPKAAPIMLMTLGMLAVGEAVVYPIVRRGIVAKVRDFLQCHPGYEDPGLPIANAFATLTIIGGAMIEGLGLYGALIAMLSGWTIVLCAPGLAIVLLLAFILPNNEKARDFAKSVFPRGM